MADLRGSENAFAPHSVRGTMVSLAAPTSPLPKTSPVGPLPPGIEERLVRAGDIQFRYLTNTKRGTTTGRDATILFLHGYPTWAEVWLPLAGQLGERHPWIAPDLPCHNRSAAFSGKDRSVSAYRRAIGSFFDAMRFQKAILIGSSLGGTLGIMLALDRPEKVDRLIVLDSAGLTPTVPKKTVRLYAPFVLPAYVRHPRAKHVRRLLQRAVFHDPRYADEAWVETIVEQWKPRSRRAAFIATGNALRRPDASVARDLEQVHARTLVVWGRQDPQFDWQIGEAAARRIPGGKFAAIESCGHFPMVEKPVETAEIVSDFLES